MVLRDGAVAGQGQVDATRAGLFIALEGVEGAGKTTQAGLLADWLEASGIPHVMLREPGGTPLGEELRRLLLHEEDLPAPVELLLLLAARAQLLERVVRAALADGKLVVLDRYELSTLAYQGFGRGLPLEQVRELNAFATGGLRPDLTLLLDVPPHVGSGRRELIGRGADRIEDAGRQFHERVAEAYRLLAKDEPGVEQVDGTDTPERVHAEILRRLRARFAETLNACKG